MVIPHIEFHTTRVYGLVYLQLKNSHIGSLWNDRNIHFIYSWMWKAVN